LGVHLILHACQRKDVQHSLTVAQDVDELVPLTQDDGLTADHDVCSNDVGVDVIAQIGENLAHGLQSNSGIEQILDDAEFKEIAVTVDPTGSAPRCIGCSWANEIGASVRIATATASLGRAEITMSDPANEKWSSA